MDTIQIKDKLRTLIFELRRYDKQKIADKNDLIKVGKLFKDIVAVYPQISNLALYADIFGLIDDVYWRDFGKNALRTQLDDNLNSETPDEDFTPQNLVYDLRNCVNYDVPIMSNNDGSLRNVVYVDLMRLLFSLRYELNKIEHNVLFNANLDANLKENEKLVDVIKKLKTNKSFIDAFNLTIKELNTEWLLQFGTSFETVLAYVNDYFTKDEFNALLQLIGYDKVLSFDELYEQFGIHKTGTIFDFADWFNKNAQYNIVSGQIISRYYFTGDFKQMTSGSLHIFNSEDLAKIFNRFLSLAKSELLVLLN